MAMGFDPKASAYLARVTLYVTAAEADKGLQGLYPGTTLTEVSPISDTCAEGTLSTTTW
jgi:hypothetical protein